MEDMKYYTSGQVARMFGVTITTILSWQVKGILIPDRILKSGHRRYSEKVIKEFNEKYHIIQN